MGLVYRRSTMFFFSPRCQVKGVWGESQLGALSTNKFKKARTHVIVLGERISARVWVMGAGSSRSDGCLSLTLVVEVGMREVGFACLGLEGKGRMRTRMRVRACVLFACARMTDVMCDETKASMIK